MKHTFRLLGLCALFAAAAPAVAQTPGDMPAGTSPAYLPYANDGYAGINLGKPDYRMTCGAAGFRCDEPDVSYHLYAGGMFNDWAGLEFGYLHLGEADRQGGKTRAYGLNASLVARVPLGHRFDAFGKLGAVYGRTRISANPLSGERTGRASGWGLTWGVGIGVDLTENWAMVVQWDRYQMEFAGRGDENIDTASIGLQYHF